MTSAIAPFFPTKGMFGSESSTPLFSAMPITAAVTATLTGVTCAPAAFTARRMPPLRERDARTIGAARGTAILTVGIVDARTIAVLVLLAMPAWYTSRMSSANDANMRKIAEENLSEAIVIMGEQAIVGGWDVSGDGYWEQMVQRLEKALALAKSKAGKVRAEAAGKIRDAARAGASTASDALDSVKTALGGIAATAGALALGPGILLGLVAFLLLESTGYGKRARAGARRYVDRRAREYGF